MILLNGHTLTPKIRFSPETMPLTLTDAGVSTASITVGPDAPEIKIDDWLKDDSNPGKGIVWRVKGVDTAYETNTRTYQLEHVIATLKDALLFGEVTTKTLGGGSTVSAKKAIQYALGKQKIWALGDFEFSRSLPYSFNNVTVYQALETVCGTLTDWRWEYDLTALPFRLHVRKISAAVGCELRSGRNLLTLRRTVDRSGMYTRFYPVGARNMHISGGYVSRNEATYGVVCKTETDQSITKKELLKAWADDRLARHAEPLVTVSISGLELSQATGEPLDHIELGLICRVPLPEYSTTIRERVTRLNWPDKIREPERVTVTLANQLNDASSIIKQISSSSSHNSAGGAKAQEEDHAWLVDTTDHVGLVAEAVAGEGAAEDWSRVASIMVDGEGIHQRVVRTEGEIVAQWAAIEVLDDKITLEVANAKSDTYSKIEQTASSIRLEVSGSKSTIFSAIMVTRTSIVTQVANAKSDTYSKIEQTASSIRSEVSGSKSTIYSTIMQTATNIYTQVGNAKSDTYSKIEQTASSIRTEVGNSKSTIFSSIMQTRTSIVTQVANAKSDTYSQIEQTASSIRTEVGNSKSTIFSSIMQTRTNIYTQVANAKSATYSTIEQTASSIRSEVSSSKSSLWSSITQTSTQISLKVGKDEVISSINVSTESVDIKASKINLSGYVTADELDTQKARITNLMNGTTTATTIRATNTYLGSSNGGNVHIYGQTVRVYSVVDTSGNTHHVFGYT